MAARKPIVRDQLSQETIDRFWANVEQTAACWEWKGRRDSQGYGLFSFPGQQAIAAHRFSYTVHFGVIGKGLLVCHHCDNPACIRPDHLFLGTHRDNTYDAMAKGRLARGPRPKTDTSLLAGQLRQFRCAAGLTQQQLADAAGIVRETVIRFERGQRGPNPATLRRLAQVLKIKLEDLA